MLVAKAEMNPGIKSALFHNRIWKASNMAMWALSPPERRCLIIKITNYDYVPLKIKTITISTGDPRSEFEIKHNNETELGVIDVTHDHQWAVDAMPLFMDIACALHEDQNEAKKKVKNQEKTEETEKDQEPIKPKLQQKIWMKMTGFFKNLPEKAHALWPKRLRQKPKQQTKPKEKVAAAAAAAPVKVAPVKVAPAIKTSFVQKLSAPLNRYRQKTLEKINPYLDETMLHLTAFEDFIEENIPEPLFKWGISIKNKALRFFQWNWHFLKHLPVFLLQLVWHIIKRSAQSFWRGLKSPFAKFNPVRRKQFQAMIELENGQIIKTNKKIGITYYFIENKIMPLMFTPEELNPKAPLSNQLLDAFLNMLQIRKEPV